MVLRHTLPFLFMIAALAGCIADEAPDDTPAPAIEPESTPAPDANTTAPAPVVALPHHPGDGSFEAERIDIPGHDGHMVPANLCRPTQAGAEARVPMLLHSHGWAGTKSACDSFEDYFAAGFGVVSLDMRGFGEAGDAARVHHVDYEIQDVIQVIDFVAGLEWVHLDAPGDPRLGALGGSYGGGYQLLTAALDDRLDAIAPEITWNFLPRSLAPDDAPKSLWLDLLYAGGKAAGTLAEEIDQGYAWVMATNDIPDGQLPGEPDIWSWFVPSSPATYPDAIDIPTFLIQGTSDTLFNFNEAAANYAQITATGAPVQFASHLNGHIISTSGTVPDIGLPAAVGVQPPSGPDPCGEPDGLIIPFYERHLIGLDVETGPIVCLALEDGSVATGDTYPLPGTQAFAAGVGFPLVVLEGVPLTADLLAGSDIPGLSDAQDIIAGNGVVDAVLYTADEETVVAGVPTVSTTVTGAAPDGIAYWYLKHLTADGNSHIINAQVTPLRMGATTGEVATFDMGGIGVRLQPGDSIVLTVANFNDQFAQNFGRTPGAMVFEDTEVTLPIVASTA